MQRSNQEATKAALRRRPESCVLLSPLAEDDDVIIPNPEPPGQGDDFEFSGGQWKPIDSGFSGDDDLKKAGYVQAQQFGGHSIWSNDQAGYRYVVEVSTFDFASSFVCVTSFLELLALLSSLSPLMQLELIEMQAELLEISRKTFRFQHRHDPRGVCVECDPDEMERRRKFRAAKKPPREEAA